MKSVSDWCAKNNLIYTGHLLGEESFLWNLASFGDMYDSLSYMHMPGFDSTLSYQFIDNYNFNITGKLAASVAHFQGKERILCEAYTGSGWNCSLRHMKRIVNRLLILGANFIQYMGAYYSIRGFRKLPPGCYPPSHSWNNTLFEHYRYLNRYMSRISWLSAKTEPCARVLVLYPATTARLLLGGSRMWDWDYSGSEYPLRKHELTIQGVVNSLMTLNQTFEMGFEQLIEEAVVSEEGEITVRGQKYDVLVLPAVTYTTGSVLKVIMDFVSCSGRLVMVNDVPFKNGDTMTDLKIPEILGLNEDEALSALSRAFAQDAVPFSQIIHGKDNVRFVVTNQFEEDNGKWKKGKGIFTELIKSCFEGVKPSALELELYHGINSCHRKAGNCHFFIIANDEPHKCTVKGRVNLPYNIEALDTDSGDIRMIRMDRNDGYTDFETELDGFESVIIAAGEEMEQDSLIYSGMATAKDIILSEGWSFETLAPNWFVLSAVPSGNPAPGSEFAAVYDFEVHTAIRRLELVTEDDCIADWYINNIKITDFKKERIWEEANNVSDITVLVQIGLNRLVAVGRQPAFNAPYSLPFTALCGDFSVEDGKMVALRKEIKPLPWNDQGWPYYAGKAVYRCEVVLGSGFNHIELSIGTNDVARVLVNGNEAGVRPWEPYRFDITGVCRQGSNMIEIEITSPYGNLFGQPVPSGLLEPPVLSVR
jgi:hypothetical protein